MERNMLRRVAMVAAVAMLMMMAEGARGDETIEKKEHVAATQGQDSRMASDTSLPMGSRENQGLGTKGSESRDQDSLKEQDNQDSTSDKTSEKEQQEAAREAQEEEDEDQLLSAVAKFKERKRREQETAEKAKNQFVSSSSMSDSKSSQEDESPSGPRSSPAPIQFIANETMDELDAERLAFEAAQRAVEEEEARQEALRLEREAEEGQLNERAGRGRAEAQRLFNEQEVKRMHGDFAKPVERKYKEQLRCSECHVGIISVPRWFAELMVKSKVRGMSLEWDGGDVTIPHSLSFSFNNAKAVIFAATSTPDSEVCVNGKLNGAKHVDRDGLAKVATVAVQFGVERLIVISEAGVSRPLQTSMQRLSKMSFNSSSLNKLRSKYEGERLMADIVKSSNGSLTYTVIRAARMGTSSHEKAYSVEASEVCTRQGDNLPWEVEDIESYQHRKIDEEDRMLSKCGQTSWAAHFKTRIQDTLQHIPSSSLRRREDLLLLQRSVGHELPRPHSPPRDLRVINALEGAMPEAAHAGDSLLPLS
ncbi:hypothetical protein GUITHDRAFT_138696 [Guillardia theta CCMP2712]|uniref:NAD(P)-binding domain-containing protein n=1 Tax=Guillardia theta (strain CCMP2712) TaxID=905079 RepID=L1JBF1_GUITC|nr:hypothetical protein GUITHDRAFT_138696 [Guillardia theta CCMP2712]EKX45858.1 hypothetical protein GUITHDRAFT_138696 [Guillardia theta CCMP2712]|eukprot:XP_005832838.1 hypothetical protein GUITHDRAFT_138696 [Guillardia theta CCMP2712]